MALGRVARAIAIQSTHRRAYMYIDLKLLALAMTVGLNLASAGCLSDADGAPDDGAGAHSGELVQGISLAPGYDISIPGGPIPCGSSFPILWSAPSGHSPNDWIAIKYTAYCAGWTPYTVAASTYAGSSATFGVTYLSVPCSSPMTGDWKVEFWRDPGPTYNYGKVAESSPFSVSGAYTACN